MNKTRKISGLLWALLLAWGSADAAGLGKLTVQSALGQPLKAEIELLSVTKDDLADITAKLATPEAFRQARIERQESLGSLRFSVDQRAVLNGPHAKLHTATNRARRMAMCGDIGAPLDTLTDDGANFIFAVLIHPDRIGR